MKNNILYCQLRMIESLETRRLMAVYVAAEYFPLSAGQTTIYQTTIDGDSTTKTRTTTAATVDGQTVTRVRDSAVVKSKTVLLDRFYKHDGRGGFRDYQFEFNAKRVFSGTAKSDTSIRILPQTFEVGTVSRWSNQPVSADIDISSLGISVDSDEGFESGRTTVTPIASETQAGYMFFNVLNVQVARTQNYTTKIAGQTFKFTITSDETWHLARGVGMISGSSTLSLKANGGFNIDFFESLTQESTLTSSTMLGGFTRVTGSALRVGGTMGNDLITVGNEGSDILVVRNDVGERITAAGITRIVIDGSDGDDTIGPLSLGAMRSTLIGGKGADNLMGGAGRDLIYGGDGNDTLIGANRSDTLYGEAGDDVLNGNGSADILDGGLGNDRARNDALDTRLSIEVIVG